MKVYVLSYLGPTQDKKHWCGKFIGVYSSQAHALRAIERFQNQPGYREYQKGFRVDALELDEDFIQAGGIYSPPLPPNTPAPPSD